MISNEIIYSYSFRNFINFSISQFSPRIFSNSLYIFTYFHSFGPLLLKCNINTFTSQSLIFEEKNEPFHLEKASNLTHEFLYDNLNKKILLNFLVKVVIQKLMCQILCIFKEKWFIFFPRNEALRSKSVISLVLKK